MSGDRRTVVVTGASAGVGRAIAVGFARRGWQVGLIARGREGLEDARREIEAGGGRAIPIQADVGDAEAVTAAAARVERELGPIDVWINNAMVTVYATAVNVLADELEQVTRVTYFGQVFGAQAALRHMRPRDRGTIVFVGSALAYRSIPFQAPYCGAKAAVRGFVDSLRSELIWEGSRVRLTAIHLPAVNTPQFDWARNKLGRKLAPVPPIFQPETVADAVFHAAETAPREVWLGFPAARAILAQMVAPGVVDWHLARAGTANETTSEPDDPNRSDNLFGAGRGTPGAHGRFDSRARPYARPLNPAWLRLGAAMVLLVGAGMLARRGINTERRSRGQGRADEEQA